MSIRCRRCDGDSKEPHTYRMHTICLRALARSIAAMVLPYVAVAGAAGTWRRTTPVAAMPCTLPPPRGQQRRAVGDVCLLVRRQAPKRWFMMASGVSRTARRDGIVLSDCSHARVASSRRPIAGWDPWAGGRGSWGFFCNRLKLGSGQGCGCF